MATEDSPIAAATDGIVDNNGIPTAAGTFSLQWQQDEGGNGTFTDISGQTASTFTPRQAQVGNAIRVCASFRDNDGYREERCSAASARVANTNDAPTGTPQVRLGASMDDMDLGAPEEDRMLTAVPGTLADVDGLTNPSYGWQWQQAADPGGGNVPAENDYANIGGADDDEFTPDQPQVGRFIRVCASFTDDGGQAERVCLASTAAVTNANDAPTGAPSLSQIDCSNAATVTAADITTVAEDACIATSVAGLMDQDGFFDSRYQQSIQTRASGGDWTEVREFTRDTAASIDPIISYTVAQADVNAGSIRSCVFYTDGDNYEEGGDDTDAASRASTATACSDPIPVTNVPDAAQGRPAMRLVQTVPGQPTRYRAVGGSPGARLTQVTQNQRISATLTTASDSGHMVTDVDGLTTDADGRANVVWIQSLQISDAPSGGTWTEVYTASSDDEGVHYVVEQRAATAGYIRACVFYDDARVGKEGGDSGSAGERTANTATLCSEAIMVNDVNDEPVALPNTITVPQRSRRTFAVDDFTYSDLDDHELVTIKIQSIPHLGSLYNNNVPIESSVSFPVADIGNLSYAPLPAAAVRTSYTHFIFSVVDEGSSNNLSGNARITINTVREPNSPATGQPRLSYASGVDGATQSSPITADQGTVMDGNNVDPAVLGDLSWQWQQGDGSGGYEDIDGATAAAFAPLQAHVGNTVRACLSFRDRDMYSETRCSQPTADVIDGNAEPSGAIAIRYGDTANTSLDALSVLSEDLMMTASQGSLADDDGLTGATFSWRWQQAADPGTGNPPDSSAFSDISEQSGPDFTAMQADVGSFVRVCVSYEDDGGNQHDFCSPTHPNPIANNNDAPTGDIFLSRVSCTDQAQSITVDHHGISTVDEDQCIATSLTTGGATMMDEDGFDEDKWQQSIQTSTAMSGADWTEVAEFTRNTDIPGMPGKPTARYAVTQADVNAGFIRSCIFYTDGQGGTNGGTATDGTTRAATANWCTPVIDVTNVDDAPTGAPAFINMASELQTRLTEGVTYTFTATSDGGSTVDGGDVADEDGFVDSRTNGNPMTLDYYIADYSWQTSTAESGAAWTEVHLSDGSITASTDTRSHEIADSYVEAGWMRICMFYTDAQGTAEGGTSTNETTRASSATLCSAPVPVDNVNDAPVAEDSTVTAIEDITYTFSVDDFMWNDDMDGTSRDNLAAIIIESLPTPGTLQVGGSDATVDQRVLVADIDTITFAPVAGDEGEVARYSSFTFNVEDDGSDGGTDNRVSAMAATMTINLTEQMPNATGAPAISCVAAPTEDAACTATQGGITDEDGVTALSWQWHLGTPAAAPNAADASLANFAELTGETDDEFTPLQTHVGNFLRACARFTDMGGTREGPLCVTSTVVVANVNDPAGGSVSLSFAGGVTVATEDQAITASSAPITDEDGRSTAVFSWQWRQDDGGGGSFTVIAAATDAAFTPLQAHVGNALRVCASFADDFGGMEQVCADTDPVVNANDLPMGQPAFIDDNDLAVTTITEDQRYEVDVTAVMDEDGFAAPVPGNNIADYSFQRGMSRSGPWTERAYYLRTVAMM